jgi:hypothetical protein
MRLMLAVMQNQDPRPVLDEIAALPLEDRYVWRIASALKWAFADFDSSVVMADRKTLRREDWVTLTDLLKVRPTQFCLFLAGLYGKKSMVAMMEAALREAKQYLPDT